MAYSIVNVILYLKTINVRYYLRHSLDRDGHAPGRVDPGRLHQQREGGERQPLHPLQTREDNGAAAHNHGGLVAVAHPGDDEALVRAARHYADVDAHVAKTALLILFTHQKLHYATVYYVVGSLCVPRSPASLVGQSILVAL